MIAILYISYDGLTDPLGQSQILPYLKGLSAKGNKIYLLTFEKKLRLNDKALFDKTNSALKDSQIDWKMLIYHKNPVFLATAYDVIKGIACAHQLAKHKTIALVHARSYVASLIAIAIKKIHGCKFIFDMRGFWPEERAEVGIWRRNSFIFRLAKMFERRFIQRADWIVVLTQRAKAIMRERYLCGLNRRVEVIPTCVDLNLFNPQLNNYDAEKNKIQDKFIFSYIGSVGTWYCLPEVIEFFEIAKRTVPGAYFLFIVSQMKGLVNNSMAAAGFTANEYTVKSLRHDEVPGWLALSRASVFFIKPVSSKLASCPTKFAESLACGVPVVINSGIGDTEEIVKEERVGVVIGGFSQVEYKKAFDELERLFADGEGLKRRCRLTAEKYFSLSSAVEKYGNIYRNLSK